jgi:predicted nuclease with TOPRIM domain
VKAGPWPRQSGAKAKFRWQLNSQAAILRPLRDEPENLVLRALRRIETTMDAVRDDIREIKTRLGFLAQQSASLSSRMDRLESRLDRIEKRLDLVEA